MRVQPTPDNLPGYVAIQLGVRDPGEKGRLRSFTYFVSLPLAREEFDTTLFDESERPDMAQPTRGGPNDNPVHAVVVK